jgi:hypothetical protein
MLAGLEKAPKHSLGIGFSAYCNAPDLVMFRESTLPTQGLITQPFKEMLHVQEISFHTRGVKFVPFGCCHGTNQTNQSGRDF